MTVSGLLTRPGLLDAGRRTMVNDLYVFAAVWRTVDLVDVEVGGFQSRLAAVSLSEAGRDGQVVQGNAADRMFVTPAPKFANIRKDDELWVGDARYRVVTVDAYAHDVQVLVKAIQ